MEESSTLFNPSPEEPSKKRDLEYFQLQNKKKGKMMQRVAMELSERCLLCFCVPVVTENKMYSLHELWNILLE